jgi:SAM-dependent methyltransferase
MGFDQISEHNRARWNALVAAGIEWSEPRLDLTTERARDYLAGFGLEFDPAGKRVLCLAAGGGQQSAVFGLLGAQVTVLDLSDGQLKADRKAADHFGYEVEIEHGDMRDLGRFEDDSFDVVWHGWSISFVPDPVPALLEAGRVICLDGIYTLEFANPVVTGIDDESWDGGAYPMREPFIDGDELWTHDPVWRWESEGKSVEVEGPREWRHSLKTVIGGLVEAGFVITSLLEFPIGDPASQPGTWEHFTAFVPPWLRLTARYRPDAVS